MPRSKDAQTSRNRMISLPSFIFIVSALLTSMCPLLSVMISKHFCFAVSANCRLVSTSSLYFHIQSEAKCVRGLQHLKLDRSMGFLSRASLLGSQLTRSQQFYIDRHNALLESIRFDRVRSCSQGRPCFPGAHLESTCVDCRVLMTKLSPFRFLISDSR